MFTQFIAKFKSETARFVPSNEGAVLPIFVIALIPLLAMVGGAVDYSRANNVKLNLQSALDAAILAGARDGSTNWSSIALNTFNANVQPQGANVGTPTFSIDANRAYTATVSASLNTEFMRVVGVHKLNINVTIAGNIR